MFPHMAELGNHSCVYFDSPTHRGLHCSVGGMTCSHLALIEKSLVVLSVAGGARVGHAQSDELADVPVLVPLQLRPVAERKVRHSTAIHSDI